MKIIKVETKEDCSKCVAGECVLQELIVHGHNYHRPPCPGPDSKDCPLQDSLEFICDEKIPLYKELLKELKRMEGLLLSDPEKDKLIARLKEILVEARFHASYYAECYCNMTDEETKSSIREDLEKELKEPDPSTTDPRQKYVDSVRDAIKETPAPVERLCPDCAKRPKVQIVKCPRCGRKAAFPPDVAQPTTKKKKSKE